MGEHGEIDGKLIVQAFEYGKAIGIADLELDKESKDIVLCGFSRDG
jgi:5'-nucleotidase